MEGILTKISVAS